MTSRKWRGVAAAAILLTSGIALASIIITETPGPHVLHAPGGITTAFPTHEACVVAAPVGASSTCSAVTNVKVEGVCDQPAPALPEETEAIAVQDPKDDTAWSTLVTGYLSEPYPECWRLGLVPLEYHGDADTPANPASAQ